ncbi:heparinase II/III family protein [Cohnella sp. REN36]|uniref:heparinase II/III domain-containing protein n=1 Tax=Cohnella sp. REN36 TaxID=2887347 RepID=UPI001D132E54|nr:heparinase II/III family protein [Cohnella sp. REN36]MCC3374783.1 heparinase II/III family protein [Cohnella sp. REN36]
MAILMFVSAFQWFVPDRFANVADAAVPTFDITTQLNDMDSATNATGDVTGTAGLAVESNTTAQDPDKLFIKEGSGSKKWLLAFNNGADVRGRALLFPKLAPGIDMSQYETMKIWAYSVKARTDASLPIGIRFYVGTDTSNYYYYRLPLDWTGWKEIVVPLDVVKTQKVGSPPEFKTLNQVWFDPAPTGNPAFDQGEIVYLDDWRLTSIAEVHPVVADKPSGQYTNKVVVSLSTLSKPSVLTSVYYLREGVDADYQRYTSPLTLTTDTTLKTKASVNGVDGEETSYAYTFVYADFIEDAVASLPPGIYAEPRTVTLSSATEGASIFYKVEGIDADFKPYIGPIPVGHSQTITAKAEFEGKTSEVKSYAYEIDLSGSGSLPISDMENFAGWTNTTPVSAPVVMGQKAGQWKDPSSAINVTGFAAPWTSYDQIEFWLYSDRASNKKVYFIMECDIPDPGFDYFMTSFFVDWTGWKKIELPFNKFLNSTGKADFANFHQLIIHPKWYDSDPPSSPNDKLIFDGMALAKNAIEPSIKQIGKHALPGSTQHYSFSLKNIGGVDTAYEIVPKTTFGSGYDVTYAPTTPVVADGAETDVDIQVTVPASAQAGETKQATYAIRPLRGGKELIMAFNLEIGKPRQATKAHPYIMVTQAQLDEAKAKIRTYDWAADYLDAIKRKADQWVDKTIYYPTKPAGQTTWFVCGDTPLVYDYDSPHRHLCPADGQYVTGDQVDAGWRFTTHTLNTEAARNLAIVYALTGEEKYARKAKEILVRYAELYPSFPIQAQYGKLFYQTLDEAVQMIQLVQAYDLIVPSGAMSEADQYSVEQNLFAASAKTLQGYDVGKSNWQTWHNAAIGAIGAALEDKTLIDFSVSGRSGFEFQMNNSVLSDGFWYEGAIGYHFYAQSALFFHAQSLRNMGYDLFANPNFKKTFDATLQYAFPDLGIINSNDSGKYPTNLGAPGRVVPMDYEAVYAEYADPIYGALLNQLYNVKQRPRGGFVVPGNTSSGIAGEQAVFYGNPVIPTTGTLPSYSHNFTGLGHSVIRAGEGADQLYALVDYGLHGGYHGHPDKLHLEIFGKGERLAPDLGIPPYSNSMYTSYYKKTFAHNTVAVDGDEQLQPKTNGVESYEPTKLFLQSEAIGIMTNTSSKAYENMDRYERTVAVTPDYLIDLFSVASPKTRQYDWILHGIGEFTPGTELAPFDGPLGDKDGYPFFRGGKQAAMTGVWEGSWRTPNGNGLKLFSLTSSAASPSSMIVGESPGPGNDTTAYTPTVVNRVNANSAQFVSVLKPFRGESGIQAVRRTEDNRIEVKLKDGRTQAFVYNGGTEAAGQLQYGFVSGAGFAAEGAAFTVALNGGEASIAFNEPNGWQTATAVVYAPGATKVTWNGEAVPFSSDNGFVMASASKAPEPGTGTGPGPGAGGYVPVVQPDPNRKEQQVEPNVAAELTLGEAFTLLVPAGAMSQSVKYKIERLVNVTGLFGAGQGAEAALSDVYEVVKDVPGLFKLPITLRFKFDASKLKPGQVPAVHYFDETKQEWVMIGGTVNGDVIEVESDHLTKFAVLGVVAPAEPSGFSDTARHWAAKEIEAARKAGYARGYPDGAFKPDGAVTRQEFAVMLANALNPDAAKGKVVPQAFADGDRIGDWAKPAVEWAASEGIARGYEETAASARATG